MTDRIVFEGGLVRHERVEVVSQAPAETLSPHLVRRIAATFPVMPSHPVRYMTINGDANTGLFMVEQPPARRSIRVRHSSGIYEDDYERREAGESFGIWQVQFPWQYWVFTFRTQMRGLTFGDFVIDESLLYWARDQWGAITDRLWAAPVPNVTESGSICWGNTNATNASLAARIDDYINTFTATIFNEDLGHNTPFDRSLTTWEANSEPGSLWRDWAFWDDPGDHLTTTITDIAEMQRRPPINMATLNPAFITPPDIPQDFTAARAREYLAGLTRPALQRIAAISAEMVAEEVPA